MRVTLILFIAVLLLIPFLLHRLWLFNIAFLILQYPMWSGHSCMCRLQVPAAGDLAVLPWDRFWIDNDPPATLLHQGMLLPLAGGTWRASRTRRAAGATWTTAGSCGAPMPRVWPPQQAYTSPDFMDAIAACALTPAIVCMLQLPLNEHAIGCCCARYPCAADFRFSAGSSAGSAGNCGEEANRQTRAQTDAARLGQDIIAGEPLRQAASSADGRERARCFSI